MKNHAQKLTLVAAVLASVSAAPLCYGQSGDNGGTNTNVPVMTVTAGQGGYVRLPDLRPAPQRYALTGERSRADEGYRAWVRSVGGFYRAGQAQMIIPAGQ